MIKGISGMKWALAFFLLAAGSIFQPVLAADEPLLSGDIRQSDIVYRAETLDDLRAIPGNSARRAVYLEGRNRRGDGGGGMFLWDGSNRAAEVAAQVVAGKQTYGIYIAPNSDPTGASGAWVREVAGPINVQWFGAKGDGTKDDTVAIQAAANHANRTNRGLVLEPSSDSTKFKITSPITLGVNIPIVQSKQGKRSTVICLETSCFDFLPGTKKVTIQNIGFFHYPRHTEKSNQDFAIRFQGDEKNRPYWNTIDNVFIDGFKTAISAQWIWNSSINNVNTVYSGKFLKSKGVSANNRITNNTITATEVAFDLDDSSSTMQGWQISNNFITGSGTGLIMKATGVSFFKFTGNVCDFIGDGVAIHLKSGSTVPGFAFDIKDNYFAFSGAGEAGVELDNDVYSRTENSGSNIFNNYITSYSSGSLKYGIIVSGTNEKNNNIGFNSINASSYDIDVRSGENIKIFGNTMMGGGLNIFSNVSYVETSGNFGKIEADQTVTRHSQGGSSVLYGTGPPSSGSFKSGDIVYNLNPKPGGQVGWICVSPGAPGVWKMFGNIEP